MDAYLQVPSFASYSSSMYPWSNRNTFTSPSPTARGGTAPVAQLNNAPTFQAFINQTIDRLISLGRGAPSAVGDGKTIGASMRWSQAALSRFPVELWPQVDLVENWHCAEVACLAPTAANLKLRHEPFPAPVHAMVLRMLAEGHIDQQFARGSDVGLGSGGGASSRRIGEDIEDEASRELETLQTLLQKAMTALEQAKESACGAEGGERGGRQQLRRNRGARPPSSGASRPTRKAPASARRSRHPARPGTSTPARPAVSRHRSKLPRRPGLSTIRRRFSSCSAKARA